MRPLFVRDLAVVGVRACSSSTNGQRLRQEEHHVVGSEGTTSVRRCTRGRAQVGGRAFTGGCLAKSCPVAFNPYGTQPCKTPTQCLPDKQTKCLDN